MFPPGKSGGLIEASVSGNQTMASGTGFRRVNPAASLKQGGRHHDGALHRRVSAG